MNDRIWNGRCCTVTCGQTTRGLALVGAVVFVGVSLYASRASVPAAPAVARAAAQDAGARSISHGLCRPGGERIPRTARCETARSGSLRLRQRQACGLVEPAGYHGRPQRRTARR